MAYFLNDEHIYLREVNLNDVGVNYYKWLNDPEVNQFLETRFVPQSENRIREFVQSKDGNSNEILFAICDRETNRHIGNIKLGPINWVHRYGDISLLIGEKDFWGKGIGSKSIRLVTLFAFNTLNLHKLRAGCYAANKGSIRAFEKNGFQLEGTLRDQWYANGSYMDQLWLGLLKEELI